MTDEIAYDVASRGYAEKYGIGHGIAPGAGRQCGTGWGATPEEFKTQYRGINGSGCASGSGSSDGFGNGRGSACGHGENNGTGCDVIDKWPNRGSFNE